MTSRLPSALDLAAGFCQGSPLRGEIEARAPGRLAEVTEDAAAFIAARLGAGAIAAPMQAHIVEAR
jgi:hypothetical protein